MPRYSFCHRILSENVCNGLSLIRGPFVPGRRRTDRGGPPEFPGGGLRPPRTPLDTISKKKEDQKVIPTLKTTTASHLDDHKPSRKTKTTTQFVLSRVGVTWYTFKQKAPKFRADWYKGAYFCKIVNFFGHYNRLDTSEGKN